MIRAAINLSLLDWFSGLLSNLLAGQDIRQFKTGIQEFRRKDRFTGGFRWLGALIGIGWPFQMECRGDEMIFGVHKMMTY